MSRFLKYQLLFSVTEVVLPVGTGWFSLVSL